MGRGTKLDLNIGANFSDGWEMVKDKEHKISDELLERGQHQLHFRREKRKGKVVTLVGPFYLNEDEAKKVLKTLKQKLSCGGAYKEQFMEFQGEQQEALKSVLTAEGFRFKH